MKLLLASVLVFLPLTVYGEYLGDLSANKLNPKSIFNDIGPNRYLTLGWIGP